MFVKVAANWQDAADVRYVVTFVDQMIVANPTRAQLFQQVARADLNPYDPFLRILARYPDDQMIIAKTAHFTACVIAAACKRAIIPEAESFLQWILQTIQNPTVCFLNWPSMVSPFIDGLSCPMINEIISMLILNPHD